MTCVCDIVRNPIFFERNRVRRVYRGGLLFHGFFGDPPEDGNFPEEWIASGVRALNEGSGEREGVSRVRGTDLYFDGLLRDRRPELLGDRKDLGVLVKILDSAVRLPVQAHPDKAFSRRHFGSEYGKTEAWLVLATRPEACVHMGFREKTGPDELMRAARQSVDRRDALESLLNRVPVREGDAFLIRAGMPHAIGPGCLILEVQEPTDFTIQPEAWCGGHRLTEREKYLGLTPAAAVSCFDFGATGPEAARRGRMTPRETAHGGGAVSETLAGPPDTDCFTLRRHRIRGGVLPCLPAPSVCVVTRGEGVLMSGGTARGVRKGDYFFIPHAAGGKCALRADGEMEIVECLPPGVNPGPATGSGATTG